MPAAVPSVIGVCGELDTMPHCMRAPMQGSRDNTSITLSRVGQTGACKPPQRPCKQDEQEAKRLNKATCFLTPPLLMNPSIPTRTPILHTGLRNKPCRTSKLGNNRETRPKFGPRPEANPKLIEAGLTSADHGRNPVEPSPDWQNSTQLWPNPTKVRPKARPKFGRSRPIWFNPARVWQMLAKTRRRPKGRIRTNFTDNMPNQSGGSRPRFGRTHPQCGRPRPNPVEESDRLLKSRDPVRRFFDSGEGGGAAPRASIPAPILGSVTSWGPGIAPGVLASLT